MTEVRRNLLVWFVNLLGFTGFGIHILYFVWSNQSELVFVIVAEKKYNDIVVDGC
jgi:hypothetical protein